MRTLLLFVLLVPCIALAAPRKVTVPAKGQTVQQTGKEKAAPGDDRPAQGAKASGDPHVGNAPAADKAKVKATSTTAGAPAKQ